MFRSSTIAPNPLFLPDQNPPFSATNDTFANTPEIWNIHNIPLPQQAADVGQSDSASQHSILSIKRKVADTKDSSSEESASDSQESYFSSEDDSSEHKNHLPAKKTRGKVRFQRVACLYVRDCDILTAGFCYSHIFNVTVTFSGC